MRTFLPDLAEVRLEFLTDLKSEILSPIGTIATELARILPGAASQKKTNEDAESLFRIAVARFLSRGLRLASDWIPGGFAWEIQSDVADVRRIRTELPGRDILVPDLVLYRRPVSEALSHSDFPHAYVSCNLTLASSAPYTARTEALNLIRNRKGRAPSIVAVTAEPLPTRLSSLALGTGDVDFVYHAALPELREALTAIGNEDQLDMLNTLVEGRRIRDIADLVLDLLI